MDLDVFKAVNTPAWDRLDELTRARHLTGAESDELVRLYQQVSTQLAQLRSAAPDPTTVSRLSALLGQARGRIGGAPTPSWSDAAHFLRVSVPAALYRIRWWIVAVWVAFAAIGVAVGIWTATNPQVMASLGTASQLKEYAEEAFAAYYSNYSAPDFAAQVWTNNAWIALQTVALGWSGIFPVYVVHANAVGVGQAGAIMGTHGYLGEFFVLITPHGLLEITAFLVAAAAGLKIFWTILVPGRLPRGEALAREGRAMAGVALGMVIVLFVSGIIEGFVPRMAIPGWVKVTVGVVAFAAFWVWVFWFGRPAALAGETGDAIDVGDSVPVAG